MEWTDKLENKYGSNEPLTIVEISGALSGYSTPRIYQLIDLAIDKGRLIRFENGIYYIPTRTVFGVSKLNPAKVVFRKYIANGDVVYGFYSGLTLLNGLGLTTQVSNVIEVVTNNEASRLREVYVGKQKVRLRCARVPITSENADALTILDLFNGLDPNKFDNADWGGVNDFIKENRLTLKKILEFSNAYPAKAVKNLMNSGVVYEIA